MKCEHGVTGECEECEYDKMIVNDQATDEDFIESEEDIETARIIVGEEPHWKHGDFPDPWSGG